jgi:lipoprotein-anchoring transpeptidase ErfK/SrfK
MSVVVRSKIAIALFVVVAALAPAAARAEEPPAYPAGTAVAQPLATPATAQPLSELVRPPSRRRGSTVARIVAPTFARARLRGRRRGWPLSTQTAWSGQPQTLLVLDAARRRGRDWVKLLLPVRPNGTGGWVPLDRVALGRTRYWIQVRTGARLVTVYRNGRRVRRFRAVVGRPGMPTPLGLAAIYERNRQPNPGGFLGPWALPLTILSNALHNYGGGPGRVGIHGRAGASLLDPLGTAASHGCIRIDNDKVSWMAASVPAGTPVRIKR